MLVLWHKGESVQLPNELEMNILQVAEHYHALPDEVENMDVHWFNRTLINLQARTEALKEESGK